MNNTILYQIDHARLGRFHLTLLVLNALCWILAAYSILIAGFLLPSLREEWPLTASALGLLAGSAMVGMLIGSILAGTLSDRFGRRATLTWALIYLGMVSLLAANAWSYPALVVLRLLTGAGVGSLIPVSSTYITEFSPAKHRGSMSTLMNACWGLGGTFAALSGYSLVLHYGWRPALLAGGLALVISPLVHFLLPESMRFLLGKGRTAQAQKELARLGLSPAEASELPPYGAALPMDTPTPSKQGIWSPLYARITGTLWFMWFSMNFLYQGAFIWLPTLLTAAQGSDSRSFLFSLVISLGQIPGTLIAAWLADRMSRRRLIALSLALLSAGSFLFGLLKNDAWVLSMGFLLMVFNGMAWGIGYPFSSELYPTRMRGSATGWVTGFGRLGGVIAPLVVGQIILGGGSINNVFTLLAVLPFLSTIILSTIKLETTGKVLEEISAE